ncbi:AAEL012763-PA [Aedes aegypti]|uniref:AAEL012763-PA n=1 Tax=Aedes aegypti TaxID=7159 RepID=Q16L45_AEDAE|nr:AAEL012763-PA [Aedes aegypti]
MEVILLLTILLFCTGVFSKDSFVCEDDKKLKLGICIIKNLNYEHLDDLTEDSFPNATHLEFRNSYIPYFGRHTFEILPEGVRQLTLRNGYVREINLKSYSPIERLQVINTDLVTLDAVSEPNYSLKALFVRSPVFSGWSASLQFLKALEVIDVAYCNFTFISLDWFEGNEKLRLLDVSNNKLKTIGSRPGLTLPALQELYIWGNRLEFLWRFPDVFPNLLILNLSDNLWRCSWVSMARDAIRDQGIVVIDSDYSCKSGWVLNGGLCCRMHADSRFEEGGRLDADVTRGAKQSPSFSAVLVDYIVNETSGNVMGMRMGNSVVYLDKHVSK